MQRYFALDKNENNFILSNNDYFHIATVMRMKSNDKIEVVFNNTLYICSVLINNDDVIIREIEKVKKIEKDINITLILPFLKEQKQDLIIQKSTELGVRKLIFLNTERTIVKIDEKKTNDKLNRWYKIAKEASEQSKRLDIPVIEIKNTFKDLENIKGINIVCDTNEKKNNIKNTLKEIDKYGTINIVIGPEGGLSLNEINYLNKIGFESVSLGNRILRVETVPLYILSIINYEVMEWEYDGFNK